MADMKWIKTNEILPLDYKRVLVFYKIDGWIECAYHFSEDGGGWITDSDVRTDDKSIDYWMPLPSPPKGE